MEIELGNGSKPRTRVGNGDGHRDADGDDVGNTEMATDMEPNIDFL